MVNRCWVMTRSSVYLFLLFCSCFLIETSATACECIDCNATIQDPDACDNSNCTVLCSYSLDPTTNFSYCNYYCNCTSILYEPISGQTGYIYAILFLIYFTIILLVTHFILIPRYSAPPSPTIPTWKEKIVSAIDYLNRQGIPYPLQGYLLMNHPVLSTQFGDEVILPHDLRLWLFYHTDAVGVSLAIIYASVLSPAATTCAMDVTSGNAVERIANNLTFNGSGKFQFDLRSTLIVTVLGIFSDISITGLAKIMYQLKYNRRWVIYGLVIQSIAILIISILIRYALGYHLGQKEIILYVVTFLSSQLLSWLIINPLTSTLKWCIGYLLHDPNQPNVQANPTSSNATLQTGEQPASDQY